MYVDSDIDNMTELMSDLGYPTTKVQLIERLERIHSQSNHFTFVLEQDNKVVSFIGIRIFEYYEADGLAAQITAFVTNRSYRGKGYGSQLIEFSEQWLNQKGVTVITLNSGNREERKMAHAFYLKKGFTQTGIKFTKTLI